MSITKTEVGLYLVEENTSDFITVKKIPLENNSEQYYVTWNVKEKINFTLRHCTFLVQKSIF